ncbi:MAG: metallophosphoesterase family protein [Sediminibacterium sp.]
MRIGVLSDIHGNSDALEAVLADVSNNEIKRLFILGDMVGYYYHPDKVLNLLSDWDHEMIKGNHEEILEEMIHDRIDHATIKAKYGSGHEAAIKKLSIKQKELLAGLNTSAVITVNDLSIGLHHGSPFDESFYLYPDTPVEILNKCDTGDDFVFVGHSHYPFIHKMPNGFLVNVGSVGQSRVKGGVASWCILDTDGRSIEMKETMYDTQKLLKEVAEIDPLTPYLSNILKRNTN